MTYTLDSGSSEDFEICLDLSTCIDVICKATDSWDYENSWSLSDESGELASGGAESGLVGTCVAGCMDDTACNYDESANISDDSCEYAEGIYDCDETATMTRTEMAFAMKTKFTVVLFLVLVTT